MIHLAVNIDHIATLREARGGIEPDPVAAASIAELAGAIGIVCHLREDRRHINDRDLRLLRETIKTKLDLEMAATEEIITIALDTLPDLVTLVPERREERTTEGGLDVASNLVYYTQVVARMHQNDIAVSFFVEPQRDQINAAATAGADIVELHTGTFANARSSHEQQEELRKLREAAAYAASLGLNVTAGHGLNYVNVRSICTIPEIQEVSIGHAIIARAAFVGLDTAVRDMVRLLQVYSH
ncbi:MAG: pyridoxine 5'-phosphate synthase [Bacteroidota bacterium]|nr:pyridoxine 5'-phosphate synthase [Candidatus Kapabacteria bacterium]MDW8220244.1 pyridoxine 5'-phosphate synthase [Bacteroidota bacterium]